VILGLTIFDLWRTDRRTDTWRQHIYRASIASCGKICHTLYVVIFETTAVQYQGPTPILTGSAANENYIVYSKRKYHCLGVSFLFESFAFTASSLRRLHHGRRGSRGSPIMVGSSVRRRFQRLYHLQRLDIYIRINDVLIVATSRTASLRFLRSARDNKYIGPPYT